MFSKKTSGMTVVGAGTTIEGNVCVPGSLQVDGCIEGTLEAKGDVSVGPDGVITGSVRARNLTVNGLVDGNVEVEAHLCILQGGTVSKDVRYETLEVKRGGKLLGTSNTYAEEPVDLEEDIEPVEDDEPAVNSIAPVGQA